MQRVHLLSMSAILFVAGRWGVLVVAVTSLSYAIAHTDEPVHERKAESSQENKSDAVGCHNLTGPGKLGVHPEKRAVPCDHLADSCPPEIKGSEEFDSENVAWDRLKRRVVVSSTLLRAPLRTARVQLTTWRLMALRKNISKTARTDGNVYRWYTQNGLNQPSASTSSAGPGDLY